MKDKLNFICEMFSWGWLRLAIKNGHKSYQKDKRRLIELELSDYLLLLVLLKSPILGFVYFKFIQKSNTQKNVQHPRSH